MSETVFTESQDNYISRVEIDLDGNVRACFKQPMRPFNIEMANLDEDIITMGTAFFGHVAKLALAEKGEIRDDVKIAEEVLANSDARVTPVIAEELIEPKI